MSKKRIKVTRVRPVVKAFNCGGCGSPVEVKVLGQTLNVVCPSCKGIIDSTDPNFQVLQEYTDKKKYSPYIPIGAMGKLKGKVWLCSGFLVKSDSGYYWREYLLYSPYYGYRWLVEVDGHWVFYKKVYRVNSKPSSLEKSLFTNQSGVAYKGQKYKLFASGRSVVEYVEGEFYWRVKRGDKAKVRDFINPPSALSVEISTHEENWTLGHHIESSVVKKAFAITKPAPHLEGVGQVQPSPAKERLRKSSKALLIAVITLSVIHLLKVVTASKSVVFSKKFEVAEATAKVTNGFLTTPTFTIEKNNTNIKLDIATNIRNGWVYLDTLLVNASTQKGIPLPLEISYYRGSDWSEGSSDNSKFSSNVPAGEYYLSINAQAPVNKLRTSVYLRLISDVPIHSNYIIFMLLVLFGPLLIFFSFRNFEVKRWSNSNFSPYGNGD